MNGISEVLDITLVQKIAELQVILARFQLSM